MNKIKRIIALLLAAVLFSTASVFAGFTDVDENPYADEISFMNQLGILNGYTENLFSPEQEFTRADFLLALMRITKVADYLGIKVTPEVTDEGVAPDVSVYHYTDVASHYIVEYINTAYDYGIIDDSDGPDFRPDDKISAQTAMKWMVRALGYGRMLSPDTEIGVYGKMASEMDLLSGVKLSSDSGIRRDMGAKLLFNMMTAPLCDMRYNGQSDLMPATLMENYYKFKKVKGVVMAYNDLSVSSTVDAKPGQIVIGTESYDHNTVGMENLLGLNVEAYYSDDNGGAVIEIIVEGKNNEKLVITPENDITFDPKISRYDYYVGTSKKTASVESNAYVVFNGVQTVDMTKEVMEPKIGKVTLINNDDDGRYDIVIIESYVNYFVSAIDTVGKAVSDSNGRKISLNDEDKNIDSVIIADATGAQKAFTDIVPENVVSVMKSEGNSNVKVRAYISTNMISGTITASYDEDGTQKIVVNEETYSIDKSSATNTAALIGRRANLYLDIFGNVAWIKFTGAELKYAYIVNGIHNNEDEVYFLNLFMVDSGKVEFFEFAEKVNIDGVSFDKKRLISNADEVAENKMKNTALYHYNGKKFIQQLVKVKLNSENKINAIDTAADNTTATSGYTRDEFTLDYRSIKVMYRNKFLFADKYILSKTTPVLRVPDQDIDNDVYVTDPKYFSKLTKSSVATNKNHNVALYDLDASREPAVCVKYETKSGGTYIGYTYDKLAFVTKMGYKLNDDEELVKYIGYFDKNGTYAESNFDIECYPDEASVNTRLFKDIESRLKDSYTVDDIDIGYGIRAIFDSFGQIYSFRVYFDPTMAYDEFGNLIYYESGDRNNENNAYAVSTGSMYFHTIYNAVGKITEVDYNKSVIFNAHKDETGNFDERYNRTFWKERFMTGAARVTILEDGKYRLGAWTDLAVGDEVFVRAYRGEALEFLIFK